MKTVLIALFALLANTLAFASGNPDQTSTQRIKALCDVFVAAEDNSPKITELTQEQVTEVDRKLRAADRCQAFINGVSNEMTGEPTWLDETHKHIAIGNWEDGVTIKQEILVFVDYVNQNPASLNKPANQTLRKSVETAGIYSYATAP